jgi:hypothetical protein
MKTEAKMIMLTSLAALALGAAPVAAQSPARSQAVTGPATVEVAPQTASAAPAKPVLKPKPKHWLGPDAAKPAARLPAPKL